MAAKLIGITGGIACGKSTACDVLRKKGYDVLDCDMVSRTVFQEAPCQDFCQKRFGFNEREQVGKVFLDSKDFREEYLFFIGPLIRERILEHPAQILEVSALFESKAEDLFQEIWVVHCDPSVQMDRCEKRYGDKEIALKWLSLQVPLQEKIRKAHYLVYSDTIETMETRLDKVCRLSSAFGLVPK